MENEKNYITLDVIRAANEKLMREGSHVQNHIPGRFIISCSVGMKNYSHELTRDELNAAYGKALKDATRV